MLEQVALVWLIPDDLVGLDRPEVQPLHVATVRGAGATTGAFLGRSAAMAETLIPDMAR